MNISPRFLNSSALPSTHAFVRGLAIALTILVCWLAVVSIPFVGSNGLDPSWQLVLNYAWTHHLVFGRELVFTYGPWGWLSTVFYYPDTYLPRVVWELFWKGLSVFLLVRVALALSWPRRVALILATMLVLPIFGDALPSVVIGGLLVWAAQSFQAPRIGSTACGILLGLLSLQKIIFFGWISAGLAGAALCLFIRKELRTTFWLAGSWFVSVPIWWLLAHQPLSALAPFLKHSVWITVGYNHAMFLPETASVFYLGVGAGLLYLALIWIGGNWRSIPLALLLSGFGFLSWKQSFVRADGHTFGFFIFILFAALAAPLAEGNSRWRRVGSWSLAVLALSGCIATHAGIMSNLPQYLRTHLIENSRILFEWKRHQSALDRQMKAVRAQNDLPVVRSKIRQTPIDAFGYEQAILLFNHLNYRPRPVIQGYQAYSAPLAELNAAFYESPLAPDYTLARLQTIDGRLPALDDARVLVQLFTAYKLDLAEKGFLLLHRTEPPLPLAPQILAQGKLRYGVDYPLPPADGRALWARLDAPLSWIGWLRMILYKPPIVTLVVRDRNSIERRFRLVVPAAQGGFLLSPLLLQTDDLERLITKGTGLPVQSFRLELPPGDAFFFLKRARFEISTLPSLEFKTATSTVLNQ